MQTDPLSEILTHVRAKHLLSGGFWAGGQWAVRFSAPTHAKSAPVVQFSAVLKGACWVKFEALDRPPLRVERGDVLLLNGHHTLIMCSDPDVEPTASEVVLAGATSGIVRWNGGDEFLNIGGHIELDERCSRLLLDALPLLILVRASSSEASPLQWMLNQLVGEMTHDRHGTSLASFQLAQLMLVHTLRGHLEAEGETPAGWLHGLRDKRITTVLRLMHGDPSHPWLLEELAEAAAMSRTNFALRFKEFVGIAPLTYLAQWRMHLAVRALAEDDVPLSSLAPMLGYTSDSAFSTAFKRIVGVAPKRYRSMAMKEAASRRRQP